MSKDELLRKLFILKVESELDAEMPHIEADDLLLEYIGDEDITKAFEAINRWYA